MKIRFTESYTSFSSEKASDKIKPNSVNLIAFILDPFSLSTNPLTSSLETILLKRLRRVELALAVSTHPRCLIADEPFLGIAPKDAEILHVALRELAESGTAIIVTGHEVDTLLRLADEVFWHTAGTTHALGDPVEARQHHQFGREYLAGISGR